MKSPINIFILISIFSFFSIAFISSTAIGDIYPFKSSNHNISFLTPFPNNKERSWGDTENFNLSVSQMEGGDLGHPEKYIDITVKKSQNELSTDYINTSIVAEIRKQNSWDYNEKFTIDGNNGVLGWGITQNPKDRTRICVAEYVQSLDSTSYERQIMIVINHLSDDQVWTLLKSFKLRESEHGI